MLYGDVDTCSWSFRTLYNCRFTFFSVATLDELVSETTKLNQSVQLKDEKIKALEAK